MRDRFFYTAVLLLIASLAFVVYQPRHPASSVKAVDEHKHPQDGLTLGVEGTLSFCSDVWPPYVKGSGSEEGYVVELLREVYEPIGFTVELHILPWSQCLELVNEGKVTAVIGTDREEAPNLIFPEETMGVYQPYFFTLLNSEWKYAGTASLVPVRLGVVQDYSYSDELDEYVIQREHRESILFAKGEDPLAILIHALHDGKIDVFVEDLATVTSLKSNNQELTDRLRNAGALESDEKMYVAFSPFDQRAVSLSHVFERRLDKLRRGGLLSEILARYNLTDWQITLR